MNKKKNTNTVIRNTAIYAVFASLLAYIIFTQQITFGDLGGLLPMPEQIAVMDLNTILLPVLISVFYIASIVGIFFEGAFSEVLVGTLYAAGFASFFATFLLFNPDGVVQEAGMMLTAAFGVILLYNTLTTYARLRKKPWLKAIMVSVTIYLEGQIAVQILSIMVNSIAITSSNILLLAFGDFINLGVTIAAIFTFFAIFFNSENPYSRWNCLQLSVCHSTERHRLPLLWILHRCIQGDCSRYRRSCTICTMDGNLRLRSPNFHNNASGYAGQHYDQEQNGKLAEAPSTSHHI